MYTNATRQGAQTSSPARAVLSLLAALAVLVASVIVGSSAVAGPVGGTFVPNTPTCTDLAELEAANGGPIPTEGGTFTLGEHPYVGPMIRFDPSPGVSPTTGGEGWGWLQDVDEDGEPVGPWYLAFAVASIDCSPFVPPVPTCADVAEMASGDGTLSLPEGTMTLTEDGEWIIFTPNSGVAVASGNGWAWNVDDELAYLVEALECAVPTEPATPTTDPSQPATPSPTWTKTTDPSPSGTTDPSEPATSSPQASSTTDEPSSTGSAGTASASGAPSPGLASTGVQAGALGLIAVVLLLGGAGAAFAVRRKRSRG